MDEQPELIEMTTEIVAAYVSTNSVPAGDLAALIHSVHKALSGVAVPVSRPICMAMDKSLASSPMVNPASNFRDSTN